MTSPAATVIGTNLVVDYGSEEAARAALDSWPSVEPLDVERLAEALKEYDAGRLRVPFAPSHVLSPDQSPSRFHRAWAKTLLDYAARLLADTPSVEPGGLRAQIETLMAESISEGKKAAAPDIAIRWDVMTRTYAKVLALLPTRASDSPEKTT